MYVYVHLWPKSIRVLEVNAQWCIYYLPLTFYSILDASVMGMTCCVTATRRDGRNSDRDLEIRDGIKPHKVSIEQLW